MTVKCPQCDTDNPSDSKYCRECATSLPSRKKIPVTKTLETPGEELVSGSTFAGRYRIIETLGEGGMGKVYRALDDKLDEEVAIKVIKPEIASDKKTVERFANELKLARKIVHKNVGRMYELMEEKGTRFITMEYVAGQDLKRLIRQTGQLSVGTAIRLAKQICDGLSEAHHLGVIHRDLKPGNIMIDRDGSVRIMDFGIARSLKEKGVTGEGMRIGTPEYMSPEQVEGKDVDQGSDIYSLGIILYEMVTGRLPFEGDTPFSVAFKQKTESPPDPRKADSQIPLEFSQVILKCLAKERQDRYQSAAEIRSDLIAIGKDLRTAGEEGLDKRPKTFKRIIVLKGSRKVLIPALAVAVLAILIVIIRPRLPRREAVPDVPLKPSIAVLPFDFLSPDKEEEYFNDGIHDDILTQLAKIKDLKVIARTSVIPYKNTKKRISEIGRELGVTSVLEGTVRKEGDRIRIGAQLIDAKTEVHLWAETYDRNYADIFAIQSDVAQKIASALQTALTVEEKRSIVKKPTENLEAYNQYLKGNYHFENYMSREEYEKAAQSYERAIELDPNFLLAYTKLVEVNVMLYVPKTWDHTEERLEKCRAALDKAIELGEGLPEVHQAKGYYLEWIEKDFEGALAEYEIALRSRPNNSEILSNIGRLFLFRGRAAESSEYFIEAYERDPRSAESSYMVSWSYILRRKWDEADRWIDTCLAGHPEHALAYYRKIEILVYGYGDLEKARAIIAEGSKKVENFDQIYYPTLIALYSRNYRQALTIRESSTWRPHYNHIFIGQFYDLLGERDQALSHYRTAVGLLKKMIEDQPENAFHYSSLGLAYAGIGDKNEAVRWGKKAVELHPIQSDPWSSGEDILLDLAHILIMVGENEEALDHIETLLSIPGKLTRWRLRLDPAYDALRNHPRFQRLAGD